MDASDHRRSRPLHRYRHGWSHYHAHRHGDAHGHHHRRRRRRTPKLDPQRGAKEAARHATRALRDVQPLELGKQIALGALLAVAIAFVALSVWAIVTVIQARDDLRGAQSEATALAVDRTQLFTAAGRAHAATQIAAMEQGSGAAKSLVDGSIPLHALSWIPFVGQQITGVQQLCGDFDTTSEQAGVLLGQLRQLIRDSHGTTISLADLDVLNLEVHHAAAVLRPLNRGGGLLVGPLASARNTFDHEIVKVTGLLSIGGHLLDYAGPFLGADGPRTYFVAGENNAEMRDQGAVLSWATLSANEGTFTMSKSHSVGTIAIRHPATVPLPHGTAAAFDQLEPEQVWQSVNATADFPLSGEVMAAMYARRTHHAVDGVIAVDPVTLKHVLDATGAVKVRGVPWRVTPANVEDTLMHALYVLYPKGYQQNRRHDEVAAVASAAVKKMKRRPYDLAYLVDQLAKAVQGRHLLVWSRFPTLETAVTRFGASGSLVADTPDAVHLAIESAVAAKLDWYVRTAVTYVVTIDPTGAATIQAKIVVANTAPKDCTPHYVCGPDHINSSHRGQYVGRPDLWLPRGAIAPGALHESGLTLLRAPAVNVEPGQKQTLLLDGTLLHAVHGGRFALQFVPQSTLLPQLCKVIFVAPGWSVKGPTTVIWDARQPVTYRWSLSR
jgi:hypothetical protein